MAGQQDWFAQQRAVAAQEQEDWFAQQRAQAEPVTDNGPPAEWQGPLTPRQQLADKFNRPDQTARARETAWEALNPVNIATGVYQGWKGELDAGQQALREGRPGAMVAHTVASMIPVLGPMAMKAPGQAAEQLEKALIARSQGSTGRSIGHAAASVVPVLGPMVADLAEQAASGDSAGAAGTLVGLGLGPKLYGAAARPIGRGAQAAASRVAGTAGRAGEWAQTAAAGAREGGMRGAVGAVVRNIAPIEPEALLMKAVRPRNTQVGFEAKLPMAMEEAKFSEQAMGRPIANFDDVVEATQLAKRRVRARYDEMAGPLREQGITINLTPAAEKMVASIPETLRIENPAAVARIEATADLYRRSYPLDIAEKFLKEANAELEGFYAKFPGSQRRALEASPEAAVPHARAQGLRDAIYGELDRGTGQAGAIQRRYGALMSLEEEAFRQANVAKRLKEQSLAEQISAAQGMGQTAMGAAKVVGSLATGRLGLAASGAADVLGGIAQRQIGKVLKEFQTHEAMIRRAFEGYKPRRPADVPNVRQLERGAIVRPAAETSGTVTPQPRDMPRSYPVSERAGLPEREPPRQLGPMPDTSGSVEPPSWMPKQYPLSPETVKGLSREELLSRVSGVQRTPGLAPEEAAQLMQILRAEMQRRGISLVPLKPKAPSGPYTQRR